MNKHNNLFFRSFLILVLCASLTLSVFATDDGSGDETTETTVETTTESTTESTTETTAAPTTETTTAPTTEATTEPTTAPTTAPSAPKPNITKDPTDEIITVDGRAVFIARADNAADMEWFVLSANGKTTYTLAEAKVEFPGLKITGEDTEKLVFEKVPLSMDGCKIYAVFTNVTGTVDSKFARLTVRKAELVPPYIKAQPKSVTAQLNEPVTLSVTADDPNEGTTLKYQWYSSTSPSTAGGSMVGGGNSATYTPSTQYKGTIYYFVKVWAESSDQTSSKTTSQVASVAVADPTPTTEATTEPTTEATTVPEETTVPEITASPAQPVKKRSNGVLFVVLFMLLLIAFGATITAIYLIRRDAMGNDDDEFDDEPELPFPKLNLPKIPNVPVFEKKESHKFVAHEDRPTAVVPPVTPKSAGGWICQCGSRNRGSYCQDCGSLKPDYAIQYACDNCGWEAPDPQNPPKQCPQCGQMYNIQDIEF